MSKPALFLDTTIQIERVVGSRTRQAALHSELADYRLITSTYVLGEYLRTIVKDAVQLHRLIAQNIYLDDAMTQIAQHLNKREASRMLLILGALLRICGQHDEKLDPAARNDLLDRLSRYIEISLPNRFMLGIAELLDDTHCGLAGERPVACQILSAPDSSYRLRCQCVRHVRECNLAELLRDRWSAEIKMLAQGLAGKADPALARMGRLAGEILADPTLARGRNCTRYLGDMIIALELPQDVALYTTNRRHFALLLAILGKKLHTPAGNEA